MNNIGIKIIFANLYEIISLYEKTDFYNETPEGTAVSIEEYLEEKFSEIRKSTNVMFLGKRTILKKLHNIIDETEYFVKQYEMPGTVERWKKINPRILFFEPAFYFIEEDPQLYQDIIKNDKSNIGFSFYPDKKIIDKRAEYFEKLQNQSTERAFMHELLRTLRMVFLNDLRRYLC